MYMVDSPKFNPIERLHKVKQGNRLLLLWRFWLGHFQGSPQVLLSRYTWELLQTVVGFWAGVVMLLRARHALAIGRWGDVVVIRGWRREDCWGGICFGSVIIGDTRIEAVVNNRLFMHEYGHTLQSRASGPTYLLRYGLPSLISAFGPGYHSLHPVELDANFRAKRFFEVQPGFKTWPSVANPVLDKQVALRCAWWEYLPPIFPFYHLGKAARQRLDWTRVRPRRD
jgi:hypothetical protein